jgi:LPXTG-site transpeptidase (sortase) family protein
MGKGRSMFLFAAFVVAFSSFEFYSFAALAVQHPPTIPETPGAPNTAIEDEEPVFLIGDSVFEERQPDPTDNPSRLIIPSIKLDTNVQEVGVTASGEMDVPDGSTKYVGWYRYGTIPGDMGSAVMDAHVYAAFAKLRYVKVGDDIYVVNARGEKLHFRVTDSRVYALDEIPLEQIFNDQDGRHLNFITCARKFIPSLNTYSHRLVVYTELIED